MVETQTNPQEEPQEVRQETMSFIVGMIVGALSAYAFLVYSCQRAAERFEECLREECSRTELKRP